MNDYSINHVLLLGVEKSKYINTISNACTVVEYYQYESSRKKHNESYTTNDNEMIHLPEKTMIKSKDFKSWTNNFGAIKQVYTTASLLQALANSSLFFLANEGDAILQASSFFNPSDVSADVKQGTLIDSNGRRTPRTIYILLLRCQR